MGMKLGLSHPTEEELHFIQLKTKGLLRCLFLVVNLYRFMLNNLSRDAFFLQCVGTFHCVIAGYTKHVLAAENGRN